MGKRWSKSERLRVLGDAIDQSRDNAKLSGNGQDLSSLDSSCMNETTVLFALTDDGFLSQSVQRVCRRRDVPAFRHVLEGRQSVFIPPTRTASPPIASRSDQRSQAPQHSDHARTATLAKLKTPIGCPDLRGIPPTIYGSRPRQDTAAIDQWACKGSLEL